MKNYGIKIIKWDKPQNIVTLWEKGKGDRTLIDVKSILSYDDCTLLIEFNGGFKIAYEKGKDFDWFSVRMYQ